MIVAEPRYVDFTDASGFSVRIEYQESYDSATLKSDIDFTAIYVSSPWNYLTYYLNGFVAVDGVNVIALNSGTATHSVYIAEATAWARVNGELGSIAGIVHNADGSKSVTISVNISGFNGLGGYGDGWNVSGSETVELENIARGIAHIGNEMYQCYIDNGTSWDMVIPHIDDGTSWSMCG